MENKVEQDKKPNDTESESDVKKQIQINLLAQKVNAGIQFDSAIENKALVIAGFAIALMVFSIGVFSTGGNEVGYSRLFVASIIFLVISVIFSALAAWPRHYKYGVVPTIKINERLQEPVQEFYQSTIIDLAKSADENSEKTKVKACHFKGAIISFGLGALLLLLVFSTILICI